MESTQKRESRRRGNQRVDPRQKTQIQIQQISKLAGEWTVGRARSLLIKPGKERARKERKRQPRIGIRERGKSDTQSPALSPPPPSLRFASLSTRQRKERRKAKQSKAKQSKPPLETGIQETPKIQHPQEESLFSSSSSSSYDG